MLGSFVVGFFAACVLVVVYNHHKASVGPGEFNVTCSVISDGVQIHINHRGTNALHQTAKAFKGMSDAAEVGSDIYQQGQIK